MPDGLRAPFADEVFDTIIRLGRDAPLPRQLKVIEFILVVNVSERAADIFEERFWWS